MTTQVNAGYLETGYLDYFGYMASVGIAADGAQFGFNSASYNASQVKGTIDTDQAFGAQGQTSQYAHALCPDASGYLNAAGYLTEAYLSQSMCVSLGAQFTVVAVDEFGAQVIGRLYNTTNLRILFDYDTRGDDGINWTSNSTEPSSTDSFHINNVNTDVVDQIWRSADGVTVGITLDCDMGSFPAFIDTLAFLNHNMTTSAVVTITLSDNPGHAPLGETFGFFQDPSDSIYIAGDLPTLGWKYLRINIDDPTNPYGFIWIGTIVGGSSLVLTDTECFTQTVRRTPVSYADGVQTEAFSFVQNFRGIRRKTQMNFRNMVYTGPNWGRLDGLFTTINTTLKALWIPTPQFPLRYMTYAKMTKIPEETHNVISEQSDFVNFVIDTDEAL
jgi:hypothetical protein